LHPNANCFPAQFWTNLPRAAIAQRRIICYRIQFFETTCGLLKWMNSRRISFPVSGNNRNWVNQPPGDGLFVCQYKN
jgi:hypothetical protein